MKVLIWDDVLKLTGKDAVKEAIKDLVDKGHLTLIDSECTYCEGDEE